MPTSVATAARSYSGEHGEVSGAGHPPAPIPVTQGRIHRFWHGLKSLTNTTVLWLSTLGSLVMLLYQYVYCWGQLPSWLSWLMPDPGAQAWLVGIAMLVGYVVSKTPHIFGQEPGDALGLVREFVLNEFNMWLALIFLVAAYFGVEHPPNAVGISAVLFIGFFSLMIGQIVQGIVLARRTWTDSSGAAAGA